MRGLACAVIATVLVALASAIVILGSGTERAFDGGSTDGTQSPGQAPNAVTRPSPHTNDLGRKQVTADRGRERRLLAIVEAPNGVPVGGAEVSLYEARAIDGADCIVPGERMGFREVPSLVALSDSRGNALLLCGAVGSVALQARCTGFGDSEAVVVEEGREPQVVHLRLGQGIHVFGQVRDRSGKRIDLATVELWTVRGPALRGAVVDRKRSVRTDIDGEFSFWVRRGTRVVLIAERDGARSQECELDTVKVDGLETSLRLTLPLERTFRGVVRGHDGAPIANARICWYSGTSDRDERVIGTVQSDRAGRFLLAGGDTSCDTWLVAYAETSGATSPSVAVPQGKHGMDWVELVVRETGMMVGSVKFPSGEALRNCQVHAVSDDTQRHTRSAVTDENGRFEIDHCMVGLRYRVVAQPGPLVNSDLGFGYVGAGNALTAPTGARCTGTLVLDWGDGLLHGAMKVTIVDRHDGRRVVVRTKCVGGQVRLEGVAAGSVIDVEVLGPDGRMAVVQGVQVSEGRECRRQLRNLGKLSEVAIHVTDWGERRQEQWQVSVVGHGLTGHGSEVGSRAAQPVDLVLSYDGKATVKVASGEYSLVAKSADGGQVRLVARFTMADGERRSIVVRIQ